MYIKFKYFSSFVLIEVFWDSHTYSKSCFFKCTEQVLPACEDCFNPEMLSLSIEWLLFFDIVVLLLDHFTQLLASYLILLQLE